ncbi:hypothetical protein BGZ73_006690 [Actinomortierella ambigua]|nr:hypothetical protein BGZ73_006690 [Actinomortierella ambigua]
MQQLQSETVESGPTPQCSAADLRAANLKAWLQKPDSSAFKNLDSNIKKNTGFIKKCKAGLGADAQTQLLNDIKKLSLEKYISEIVTAVLEGLLRCKNSVDVAAALEVVSALHQRFPDTFTLLFTYQLHKALAPAPRMTQQQMIQAGITPEQREKEESSRVARQRVLCRIAAELWLVGVLRNVEDGITTLSTEGNAGIGGKSGQASKDLVGSSAKDSKAKGEQGSTKTVPNFIYNVLQDLLSHDKEHINLPIAITVVKTNGKELTGVVPRKAKASAEGRDADAKPAEDESKPVTTSPSTTATTVESIVPPPQQAAFKALFVEYYKGVEAHLIRDHKELRKLDRKNEATLFSKGELSEERQQQYEKVFKAFEKLQTSTQSLADGLDIDMPILKDEKEDQIGIIEDSESSGERGGLTSNVFEDEDDVMFYEHLLDLKTLVPVIFLESKPKKDKKDGGAEDDKASKDSADSAATKEDAKEESMEDGELSTEIMMNSIDAELDSLSVDEQGAEAYLTEPSTPTVPEANTPSGKPSVTQLDALLAKLPNMCNRDMIDQAAVEFCYLNTKAARARLIRIMVQVPRDRHDLLPYYSRLIATLKPYFPDIAEEVVNALGREFKGLLRKKHFDLSESRVKNIKFLSELVKFGVTPLPVIFYCLKTLLDDFVAPNITVLCALLEACGRYLKRKSAATSARLDALLEILKRKRAAMHLEPRILLMLDNAYYQCNPPEQTARHKREVPPMEQFIKKLLYLDLCKKTVDQTHKLLRKLDWENKEIYNLVLRLFTKVWKIKFSNIHLMAILVNGLSRHLSDFSIAVVDTVVEHVRVGLETNNFRDNQKRIAIVKYLGELYNYRMVDSPLIFSTLHTLITFGHENGRASIDRPSAVDPPHDSFRIRLICTLLDCCGICFDHGRSKAALDTFLVQLQLYIFTKENIPLEVEFMIEDTLTELRPKMKRLASYEEALAAVETLVGPAGAGGSSSGAGGVLSTAVIDGQADVGDDSDSEDEDVDDDGDGDDDNLIDDGEESTEEDEGDQEDDLLDGEDEEGSEDEDEEEEQAVVMTNHHKEQEPIDEDFEREYLKMMTESLDSRKFERKHGTLDVTIPVVRAADRREEAGRFENPDSVPFMLLTKKGNKQQIKTVALPSDSSLVINTRNQREAEREEQQQLKQIVLDYEVREEANQRAALEQQLRNQGFNVNFSEENRRSAQGGGHHHQNQQHQQQQQQHSSSQRDRDPRNQTRWARNQAVGVGAGHGTESALQNLGVDGYERRAPGGQLSRNNYGRR